MWLLSTFILYLSVFGIVKSTVDYLQHPVKPCHVGDVVENQCNKCLCTSKGVFECTPLDCSSQTSYKEIESIEPQCFSNQLYVQNLITCICTKDGKWPHKSCHDTFKSLPPRIVTTHKCVPNTYIAIDCNVCRCGPDGEILNDRCTRNACEDEVHRRSSTAPNTVFSKCEEKYWYSLAPCQFCYCVNQNKLVCNTGNYYNRNLDLGSYKLNVCGKDLIKEAIELIPDNLRTLRIRPDVNNTSKETKDAVKLLTKSDSNKISANQLLEINLKDKKKYKSPQRKNTTFAFYSEESEAKEQNKTKPKLVPTLTTTQRTTTMTTTDSVQSTQFPDQDPEETEETAAESVDVTKENLEVKTIEDDDDETQEIGIQFDQNPPVQEKLRADPYQNIPKQKVYKYDGKTLNIDVNKALKKVFKLALRKSMVSLSKKTKCTPGTTTVHDCNMCFCLKNNKQLCTTDRCVGGRKA